MIARRCCVLMSDPYDRGADGGSPHRFCERNEMKLSPTEIFKGKKIFMIGGTGFVGKVTLSMLLNNFPDIGRVYATVRARDARESENRFWTSIVTSPTFDPLREKYGDGFEEFIRAKVVPVNGDVGNEFLGMSETEARAIM